MTGVRLGKDHIMARRHSSLGLFGIFGRSADLRQLDQALRGFDLHTRFVPEAVKLTAVNLLKDHAIGDAPAPQSYPAAAEILAYCMLGRDSFAGANGEAITDLVERRIEGAVASGNNLDAQLVLLTLQARVIQPSVVAHFGLEMGAD
jgi:hypothetical protein